MNQQRTEKLFSEATFEKSDSNFQRESFPKRSGRGEGIQRKTKCARLGDIDLARASATTHSVHFALGRLRIGNSSTGFHFNRGSARTLRITKAGPNAAPHWHVPLTKEFLNAQHELAQCEARLVQSP